VARFARDPPVFSEHQSTTSTITILVPWTRNLSWIIEMASLPLFDASSSAHSRPRPKQHRNTRLGLQNGPVAPPDFKGSAMVTDHGQRLAIDLSGCCLSRYEPLAGLGVEWLRATVGPRPATRTVSERGSSGTPYGSELLAGVRATRPRMWNWYITWYMSDCFAQILACCLPIATPNEKFRHVFRRLFPC